MGYKAKDRIRDLKSRRVLSVDERSELERAQRARVRMFEERAAAAKPVPPDPGSAVDRALSAVRDLTLGGVRSPNNPAFAATRRPPASAEVAAGLGDPLPKAERSTYYTAPRRTDYGDKPKAGPSAKGVARDTVRPSAAVKPRDLDQLGKKGAGPRAKSSKPGRKWPSK